MGTSISYKGNVIASFGNSTKTLNTAGTWLEDDITVTATDSSAAITVVQELDEHGGIIKHINAIDLSSDTVDAAHLLQGYTAHDHAGEAITGTYTGPTPTSQTKTVTPTKSTQNITPDVNYDYLSSVTINPIPNQYIIPSGTKNITQNGTSDVTNFASVSVNVPTGSTINNQNKTVTPTELQQSITADTGYTGLGTVTVNAISSTYVGSGITRRDGTDLTASGATISVPAGYYEEQESKSVSTTTHSDPTVSINSTTGLITASHTQTAGYVTAGTTTDTLQLTTQAAATITPSESSQTAITAGKYTTGAITVSAISPTYVGSSIDRNDSTDLTASGATVTVPAGYYAAAASKSVASGSTGTPTATKGSVSNHSISVTPSVTNSSGYITGGTKTGTAVTVSASELVSGSQTISQNGTVNVTNLSSVTVAIPIVTYYTGSSAPSSSFGSNGDIYLQS